MEELVFFIEMVMFMTICAWAVYFILTNLFLPMDKFLDPWTGEVKYKLFNTKN